MILVAALASAAVGCPAPLPPLHAYGAVGSAKTTPKPAPDADSPFTYSARVGVHPLGYSTSYSTERTLDFGLGYQLEQMPILEAPQTLHGPYLVLDAFPSMKPTVTARLGVRAFAELLMLETDRLGHPGAGHRELGYGSTLMLAWEATGSLDADIYERRRTPATFGYGRGAWGLFAAGSFRDTGDQPHFVLGVGVSLRVPVTVADVATRRR